MLLTAAVFQEPSVLLEQMQMNTALMPGEFLFILPGGTRPGPAPAWRQNPD
jgi:hypothetical protein